MRRPGKLVGKGVAIFASFIVIGLAAVPLFHAGLFPTIDNISVVRLESMAKELGRGQFPVRYASDLARGHGYMLFNYYAPLPFYSGALIRLARVNLVGALKRTYLAAFVLGGMGIFALSAEFFGPLGGAVSSAFYAFSPFIGYDIYWRGGLGEAWAMSLTPWVLWCMYRGIRRQSPGDAVGAGIAWAAVLLSHNLTAYLSFPFVGVWALWWIWYFRRSLWYGVMSIVLGFGLAAFFWLPAFVDRGQVWVSYLQAGRDDLFKNFVWGTVRNVLFPTFIPMITNWFAIFTPLVIYFLVRRYVRDPLLRGVAGVSAGLFALAAFLASGLSRPVWSALFPVMYIFQFPWRFLTMVTVFGAVLVGAVAVMPKRYRLAGSVILILLAVLVNWANFRPKTYEFVDRYLPEDPCGTSWGFEYIPTSVKTCLKTSWGKPYHIDSGDLQVTSFHESAMGVELSTESTMGGTLQSARYYYPAWRASIDGQTAQITPSYPNGLMDVHVPSGSHTVRFELRETPLQRVSTIISGATGIGILLFAGWELRRLFARTKLSRRRPAGKAASAKRTV